MSGVSDDADSRSFLLYLREFETELVKYSWLCTSVHMGKIKKKPEAENLVLPPL
jgi:hypothetical protein